MTPRKRLDISLAVIVSIFWIGVVGYMLIDRDLGFIDAIYQTAITLSTVGYREVSPPTTGVKLWSIAVIIFGISAVLAAFTSLIALIVEGEVGRLIGSRKLESRIKKLNNHSIVCGFGRMGELLVKRLIQRKVPVVIIEKDQKRLIDVEEIDQLYVVGDATEEATLKRAGIDTAKSLVAALTSDADNVFVTLTARQMRPDLQIVARAEQFTTESKLKRAGADRVMSPQTIGAERIANVLTRPYIVDFVDVAAKGVELEMDQFVVAQNSRLAGKSLRDSNIRQVADVMVIAIVRTDGSTRFNPGADEIVRPNDTLITIGPAGTTSRLEQIDVIKDS
ncbi:MAG: potassium channel family protein [Planctomycetota bacterium]|jgi:voltage-gated potassium channel